MDELEILIYYNMKNKYAIIGAILGIPLSYYFQNDMVQMKVGSVWGYIKNMDMIFFFFCLVGNLILSVIIFGIVGYTIGYYIEKNKKKQIEISDNNQENTN